MTKDTNMKTASKIAVAAALLAAIAFPAFAGQNQASEASLNQLPQASAPYDSAIAGTIHHVVPWRDLQLDGRGL